MPWRRFGRPLGTRQALCLSILYCYSFPAPLFARTTMSGQEPSGSGRDDSSSVLGEVLVNQRSLRTGPEVRGRAPDS